MSDITLERIEKKLDSFSMRLEIMEKAFADRDLLDSPYQEKTPWCVYRVEDVLRDTPNYQRSYLCELGEYGFIWGHPSKAIQFANSDRAKEVMFVFASINKTGFSYGIEQCQQDGDE